MSVLPSEWTVGTSIDANRNSLPCHCRAPCLCGPPRQRALLTPTLRPSCRASRFSPETASAFHCAVHLGLREYTTLPCLSSLYCAHALAHAKAKAYNLTFLHAACRARRSGGSAGQGAPQQTCLCCSASPGPTPSTSGRLCWNACGSGSTSRPAGRASFPSLNTVPSLGNQCHPYALISCALPAEWALFMARHGEDWSTLRSWPAGCWKPHPARTIAGGCPGRG